MCVRVVALFVAGRPLAAGWLVVGQGNRDGGAVPRPMRGWLQVFGGPQSIGPAPSFVFMFT